MQGADMKEEKLRYAILKELFEGNENPTNDLLSDIVTLDDIVKQARFLEEEGYTCGTDIAENVIWYGELTKRAKNNLEENYNWSESYNLSKKLGNWIIFFAEE